MKGRAAGFQLLERLNQIKHGFHLPFTFNSCHYRSVARGWRTNNAPSIPCSEEEEEEEEEDGAVVTVEGVHRGRRVLLLLVLVVSLCTRTSNP